MFYTPEDLAEISSRSRGDLEQIQFAVLLRALAETRRTCVLEIRRRRLFKRIAIEAGTPVACESNLAHERFGTFLLRAGRLNETEYATSLSASITRGVPLGEILVERELLTLDEVFRYLQQCLGKQLLDGFTWSDGEFALLHEPLAVPAPLKVKVHQLIVTGLTRFAPQDQVDSVVMTLIGRELALHPAPVVAVDELRLDGCSSKICQVLGSSQHSLSEIAARSQHPIEEVARSVYALGMVGLLVTADELERIEQPGVVTQPIPQIRFVPGTDTTPDEVMRLFLAHRRLDAFDLLGVDDNASAADVERAYAAFAQRFAPWNYEAGPLAVVREQARELFLVGSRAYSELADDGRRRSLRERRRGPTASDENASTTVGPGRIQTDLLDSEAQHKKGLQLLEAGKVEAALQHLEFASDCDPQNGLYRAQLAHCRYLVDRSSSDTVLAHLIDTHRIDPGCGLAYLYAGEIAGELEQYDRAESFLREASRLMAPDRRPIEALKHLSALRRKRKAR